MKFLPIAFLPLYLSTFLFGQSISVSKKTIDIGQVEAGTIFGTIVEIKNLSSGLLKIGLRPSCDCITAKPDKLDLKQDQEFKIKIKVDTTGYKGKFREKIYVQSNDPGNPYIPIDVRGYITSTGPQIPNYNRQNDRIINKNNKGITIPITFFDSAGCLFCIELKKSIIPKYEKQYAVMVELTEYQIDEPKNYEKLIALEQQLNKPLTKMPVILIGYNLIGGKHEILKNLPSLLEKYSGLGSKQVQMPSIEKAEQNSLSPIENLKIVPVVIAGLIDSVNPCAFATIIFFITYTSMVLKKQKSEVLLIGICFIIGVFITYFLIGIGLLKFILKIRGIELVSQIMYFLVGIFAFFLSYLYARDAIAIKRGTGIGSNTIKTKLPNVLRWKIYDVITKFTTFRYLILVAFLLGSIITAFELFCTGQIFLPTIMYITALPQYRINGIMYLLLYCLLFTTPLIVIFLLFYFGLSMDQLETFFREKIFIIKLLASALLLTLGIIIFTILFFV